MAHTRIAIQAARWHINGQLTYPGAAAEGLLMNVRMVNAAFEDAGPQAAAHLPPAFHPDANTAAFIARLPDYVAHGVRAFTLGLQGGMPGYEGAVNCAFDSDGSLRSAYLQRVQRVIETCDRHGAAVILSCFYQRQAAALSGRLAIRAAVQNVALWLRRRGYTNVLLEISNEYAHGGYRRWRDGPWLSSPAGQIELIQAARAAAPGLLVSTSGMGDGTLDDRISAAADFLLIHLNGTPLAEFPARLALARRHGKPVVCNEDDKIGPAGAAAARLCVQAGVSWGFMHRRKNQFVPFEFDGPADDPLVYAQIKRLTCPRLAGQQPAPAALPEQLLITQPNDGASVCLGQPLILQAIAPAAAAELAFFAMDRCIGRLAAAPWRLAWTPDRPGRCDLTVRAVLAGGSTIASHPIDVFVHPRPTD